MLERCVRRCSLRLQAAAAARTRRPLLPQCATFGVFRFQACEQAWCLIYGIHTQERGPRWENVQRARWFDGAVNSGFSLQPAGQNSACAAKGGTKGAAKCRRRKCGICSVLFVQVS